MSKRKLFVTILIFVLVIAVVVGASYLVSLLLKNFDHSKTVNSPEPIHFVLDFTTHG